jgi:hypothetical protein
VEPSITDTHELVVPRSIPITFAIVFVFLLIGVQGWFLYPNVGTATPDFKSIRRLLRLFLQKGKRVAVMLLSSF